MDKYIFNIFKQYKFVLLLLFLIITYSIYFKYFETFNMDKTEPIYIASKSFIYMCDHYTPNPFSESTEIPDTYPKKDGDKIYIHNTALGNFANNYLPNIKYKFFLLSGDTDKTIPDDDQSNVNTILNSPLLIAWYSQNCTKESTKLKQLPIGLDYHTQCHGVNNKLY